MASPKQVMRERLIKERKEEIEKDLKKGKNYIVVVSTQFAGEFVELEETAGEFYAIFKQRGVTDKGKVPLRKVKVENVVSYVEL